MGASIPGYKAGRSVQPREIRYAMEKNEGLYLPGGGLFDKGYADNANTGYTHELRAGLFAGKSTATGKWRPLARTQVLGPVPGTAITEIPVDDASAFKVGDVITVGGDTGNTVTAVNYTTNTVTVSAAIIVADNEPVFAEGGAGVAMGILDDHLVLQDEDGVAVDKVGKILIDGKVDYNMLLGDVDAIIATWDTHLLDGIQIWDKGTRRV